MTIVIPEWFSDEEAQEGLIALGIMEDLTEENDEGSEDSSEDGDDD